MGYYNHKSNIDEFVKESGQKAGIALIDTLITLVSKGSAILELGIGPGHDLTHLSKYFRTTGSDKSELFLENYKEKHPKANLLQLNAIDLKTNSTFDAIYSNKVLHHLYRDELKQSISRQAQILNTSGFIAHSFWSGSKEEDYLDLHFVYYKLSEIRALFDPLFRILHLEHYSQKSTNDSIYVVGKKR